MKHAHAELLHRLVDDCTLFIWYWNRITNEWRLASSRDVTTDTAGAFSYALGDKPTSPPKRYAMVEGVRVPMTHLTVAPNQRFTPYWYFDSRNNVIQDSWTGGNTVDSDRLNNQNCFATESDAQEAATAWAQVRKNVSERTK